MPRSAHAQPREALAGEPILDEVLPRVVAGIFAVWTLVAVSCVVALVGAYLVVYGFAAGGFATYTRTVGQVFSPDVSLIFVLKIAALRLRGRPDPDGVGVTGPRAGARTRTAGAGAHVRRDPADRGRLADGQLLLSGRRPDAERRTHAAVPHLALKAARCSC